MPIPPANERITNVIRIASGSTPRWRPRPPATPPMTESDVERVSGGRGGSGGGSGGICSVGCSSLMRRPLGESWGVAPLWRAAARAPLGIALRRP